MGQTPRDPPGHGRHRVRRLLGPGTALTLVALGLMPPGAAAAGPDPPGASAAPASLVTVELGRVTVDVTNAELAEVLTQIASRGGFRLKTLGQLGHVTTAFANLSLERALRRLARDHELMLVYGAPAAPRGDASLLEVAVFAAPPARGARDRGGADPAVERAAILGEIDQLSRAGDGRGIPRLAELLGAAPDPTIRARAARALGRLGEPGAAAALTAALGDQSPAVRVQVVHALRSVQGPQATPALGDLLLTDPDVTVRRTVARLLGGLPDPAAIAALSRAAGDQDAAVRLDVRRALQRQGLPPPR